MTVVYPIVPDVRSASRIISHRLVKIRKRVSLRATKPRLSHRATPSPSGRLLHACPLRATKSVSPLGDPASPFPNRPVKTIVAMSLRATILCLSHRVIVERGPTKQCPLRARQRMPPLDDHRADKCAAKAGRQKSKQEENHERTRRHDGQIQRTIG